MKKCECGSESFTETKLLNGSIRWLCKECNQWYADNCILCNREALVDSDIRKDRGKHVTMVCCCHHSPGPILFGHGDTKYKSRRSAINEWNRAMKDNPRWLKKLAKQVEEGAK